MEIYSHYRRKEGRATEGSVYKANINIKLKLPNLLGQGSDDKLFIEPKWGGKDPLNNLYRVAQTHHNSLYGVKQINKQRDI
jgi:hypothetical protein